MIVRVTPLNSIGNVKLRESEPTAVRATTGGFRAVAKSTIANMPGAIPKTDDGVTGVGLAVGVAVGVGVGVGVAVGDGVGVGEADIGRRLAPVEKFIVTVAVEFSAGVIR